MLVPNVASACAFIGIVCSSLPVVAQPLDGGVASSKPKVAVLAIQAEGGVSQGAANLLTEIVTTDLSHANKFEVLSSADINTMIGFERQKQLAGCKEDDTCFAEIGSALGVDLIVTGSVGALGAVRVLTLRAYDAKRSRPYGRETATVETESGLVPTTHATVAKLFGLVSPPPPAENVVAASRPIPAGWFVLGGAGVLAIGGVVMGVLANDDYERFKKQPFDDALGNSAQGKAIGADVLYGTAVVAAAISVVLFIVQKPAPAAEPTVAALEVSP